MQADGQIRSEIEALEERRIAATIAADVDTLREIFVDDMIWIHGTGRVDTRDSWLERVGSKTVRYTQMSPEQTTLRTYADTVVVTGEGVTAFINPKGEHTVRMCFTTVYCRIDGVWKNVSMQVTKVA